MLVFAWLVLCLLWTAREKRKPSRRRTGSAAVFRASLNPRKPDVADSDDLRMKRGEFRAGYNHARPHQHLGMRTPAEAWSGRERATGTPRWLRVWDGELVGWYFPP